MACKYKFGDRVEVNGHKGKITSVYQRTNNPGYICTVTFDDTKLIPNRMDFKEEVIKMVGENIQSDTELKCNCGTEKTYGKVPVNGHSHYCDLVTKKNTGSKLKVEFKKEDVKPPGAYSNDPYEDLLDQFELMLGSDDDDDDFGFYGI